MLGRRWAAEIVGARRHRTTGRVVTDAWLEEQPMLVPIPTGLLHRQLGTHAASVEVIDLAAIKALGAVVDHRNLADYGRMTP